MSASDADLALSAEAPVRPATGGPRLVPEPVGEDQREHHGDSGHHQRDEAEPAERGEHERGEREQDGELEHGRETLRARLAG